MTRAEMTAAAKSLVQRSRSAQGLPARVRDPGALERVAALLADDEVRRAS